MHLDSFNHEENAIIFDIQDYCIDDGPGIRTLIFFKGCPLRCPWCSNPESQSPVPEIMFSARNCNECLECVQSCPHSVIELKNKQFPIIDTSYCAKCLSKICAQVCSEKALKVVGFSISVNQLYNKIITNSLLYRNSGGGITLSGGEPLMQENFIRAFLQKILSKGISVGIETCGLFNYDKLADLFSIFDFFFFDLKIMRLDIHQNLIGMDNQQIHENLKKLALNFSEKIKISIPIVPKVNDFDDNILDTLKFCSNLNIDKVRFLRYHEWGISKYEELGRSYKLTRGLTTSEEKLKKFTDYALNLGFKVEIL